MWWFRHVIQVERGIVAVLARRYLTGFDVDTVAAIAFRIGWRARQLGLEARIAVITRVSDEDLLTRAEGNGVAVLDEDCRLLNAPGWLSGTAAPPG